MNLSCQMFLNSKFLFLSIITCLHLKLASGFWVPNNTIFCFTVTSMKVQGTQDLHLHEKSAFVPHFCKNSYVLIQQQQQQQQHFLTLFCLPTLTTIIPNPGSKSHILGNMLKSESQRINTTLILSYNQEHTVKTKKVIVKPKLHWFLYG